MNEAAAEVPTLGYSALKETILIESLNEHDSISVDAPEIALLTSELVDEDENTLTTADLHERAKELPAELAPQYDDLYVWVPPAELAPQYDDVYMPAPPPVELPYYEEFLKIAVCESEMTWNINTGNSFFGGLQFTQQSWEGVGGLEFAERADLATPYQQIVAAHRLKKLQGWGAWPACSLKLGYRE